MLPPGLRTKKDNIELLKKRIENFTNDHKQIMLEAGKLSGFNNIKPTAYFDLFGCYDDIRDYADPDKLYGLAKTDNKVSINKSIQKFRKAEVTTVDHDHFKKNQQKVDSFLEKYFERNFIFKKCEILTSEDLFSDTKLKSSAGFGHPGNQENYLFTNFEHIKRNLDYPLHYLKTHDPVMNFAVKDEVRLNSKDPRTYLINEYELNMIIKKYSWNFNEQVELNHFDSVSSVGLSWLDWHRKMKRYAGNPVVCWDGENFDRSLSSYLMWHVVRLRQHFIVEESDKQNLEYAYSKIINKTVIGPDGTVYCIKGGNPSGQPNTTIDNVISHLTMFAYFWLYEHEDLDGFETFLSESHWTCYGDDGYSNLLPKYNDFFLRCTDKYWKRLNGLDCTRTVHKDFHNGDFLGRKSYTYGDVIYPIPSDLERLTTGMSQHIKKSVIDNVSVITQREVAYLLQIYPCSLLDKKSREYKVFRSVFNRLFKRVSDINQTTEGILEQKWISHMMFKIVPEFWNLPPLGEQVLECRSMLNSQALYNTTVDMLTKQEFLEKHRVKYAGLTAKEKEARWKDFVNTEGLNSRGARTERAATPSNPRPITTQMLVSGDAHTKEELKEVEHTLYAIDECCFGGENGVPGVPANAIPIESRKVFQMRASEVRNASGDVEDNALGFLIQADISRNFKKANFAYDATAKETKYVFAPGATSWEEVQNAPDYKELYQMFIVTHQSAEVRPLDPALEMQGKVTWGVSAPDEAVLYNASGVGYSTLANFQYAHQKSAKENSSDFNIPTDCSAYEARDTTISFNGVLPHGKNYSSPLDVSSSNMVAFLSNINSISAEDYELLLDSAQPQGWNQLYCVASGLEKDAVFEIIIHQTFYMFPRLAAYKVGIHTPPSQSGIYKASQEATVDGAQRAKTKIIARQKSSRKMHNDIVRTAKKVGNVIDKGVAIGSALTEAFEMLPFLAL